MTETAAAAQVRIAWLVVVLAAVLGFACIVLPAQRRIAAIEEHAAGLGDLAAQNEALLARLDSPRWKQTRTRVRRDLRALIGEDRRGKDDRCRSPRLGRRSRSQPCYDRRHLHRPATQPSAPRAWPREEEVAVSLRGRYRDVMNAIADLPRHDALVEVRSVSLTRVDARQLFPSVDATVRVALFPDVKELMQEETHAQTPSH